LSVISALRWACCGKVTQASLPDAFHGRTRHNSFDDLIVKCDACKLPVLEGYAEKFVLSPDQSAPANGSEAVKGQLEMERHYLQVLAANAGTQICDVANCARLYAGSLAEKCGAPFMIVLPIDRRSNALSHRSRSPRMSDMVRILNV
jgi:hypothetical protein